MLKREIVLALASTFFSISAYAATDDATPDTLIRARLAGEGAQARQINASLISGLFEVVLTDNTIIYTSPDGRFMIVGDMIDTVAKKAITRDRAKALAASQYPELPHDLTVVTGTKGAKRTVFVIADPNCPYCHKFYQKLKVVPDLEIHTLVVAILGADSQHKAMSILCAPNPAQALEAMMENRAPAPATCAKGEQTLRAAYAWFKEHPTKSTPTTYFSNGVVEYGDASEETIARNLQ